jgi:hypothetical protein
MIASFIIHDRVRQRKASGEESGGRLRCRLGMGVLFTRQAVSAGIAMKTREICRGGQLCLGAVVG